MKTQLFGISEQLPQMAKIIRGNISAGRWSWLWDRVAVQAWVRAGKLPQNFSMAGHSLGGYLAAIVVGFLA